MVRQAPDQNTPRRGALGYGVEVPTAFDGHKISMMVAGLKYLVARLAAANSLGEKDLAVCRRDGSYEVLPPKPVGASPDLGNESDLP